MPCRGVRVCHVPQGGGNDSLYLFTYLPCVGQAGKAPLDRVGDTRRRDLAFLRHGVMNYFTSAVFNMASFYVDDAFGEMLHDMRPVD